MAFGVSFFGKIIIFAHMKWIRNLLKGFSLTAALFVFQACYGSPPVQGNFDEIQKGQETQQNQEEPEVELSSTEDEVPAVPSV